MIPFHFLRNAANWDPDPHAKVAWIPNDTPNKMDLLDSIATQLEFPTYMGRNWDALFDALRDLSWLRQPRIVLFHENLPVHLGEESLAKYLDVLRDAAAHWQDRTAHILEICFPLSDRDRIENLTRSEPENT